MLIIQRKERKKERKEGRKEGRKRSQSSRGWAGEYIDCISAWRQGKTQSFLNIELNNLIVLTPMSTLTGSGNT